MSNNNSIALYARVSKRVGQTVENQIPILENWAQANNFNYEVHVEKESTRNFRPVREALIARLRSKQSFAELAKANAMLTEEIRGMSENIRFVVEEMKRRRNNDNSM